MKSIPTLLKSMTAFPHSIEKDASATVAAEMLAEHNIRHLPVVDGQEIVGIVSERDLALTRSLLAVSIAETDIRIESICSKNPYTVDVHTSLDTVLLEMSRKRADSAIVLKNGHLVGIFTVTDACESLGKYLKELNCSPDDEIA